MNNDDLLRITSLWKALLWAYLYLLKHLGVRLLSLMCDTGRQKSTINSVCVCVLASPVLCTCITRLWTLRVLGVACLPLWCCTSVPWADINSLGCCVQLCVCQKPGQMACRVKAFLRFFRSRAELDLLFTLLHTKCCCSNAYVDSRLSQTKISLQSWTAWFYWT